MRIPLLHSDELTDQCSPKEAPYLDLPGLWGFEITWPAAPNLLAQHTASSALQRVLQE